MRRIIVAASVAESIASCLTAAGSRMSSSTGSPYCDLPSGGKQPHCRIQSPTRADGFRLVVRNMNDTTQLDQIAPETVLKLYISEREPELAANTLQSHRYVIERFVEWCDTNDIDTVADLTGRDLHEFRIARREDVNGNTLRSQLGVLRQYVQFAESIEAATMGLAAKIRMPQVERVSRDGRVTEDTATAVLDYLRKFQYASRDHALIQLLWKTGVRVGTARAFDTTDFDPDERTIAARHRPETDTPLKNGKRAERLIALDDETTEVLTDYVEHTRPNCVDSEGRKPLFASEHGRVGCSTLRRVVYRWTRPCKRGEDCPHGRQKEDCEAYRRVSKGSQCPSTHSPHEIRRGAISHLLTEQTPVRAISDRADVSERVLDEHYDARSEKEKAETRREYFE